MYKLVISDDEGKTTVVPLVRDEITIGRKEGNTIRLTERNVSRRHARLFKSNGAFTIEDLSSYNGIKVNGRKIGEPSSLKAGDQVTIGDYLLALQVDAAETMTEPTTPMPQPEQAAATATADAPTAMVTAPSTEPVPPARVVMLSPPAPGAEFALGKPRVRFGRAEDLDAWVNHRSISREHAEIVREGDTHKIVDLGSANGIRVNGHDTREAVLQPGDVIEMGQVRFRFVGKGEAYVFDADQTIQMEAVPGGASRAPIFAAVGIIVVAVAIGGVIAMGGGEAEEEPVAMAIEEEPQAAAPAAAIEPPATGPATPSAADLEAFQEALSQCQDALEAQRYSEAVMRGNEALRLAAGNDEAHSCRQRALDGQAEQEKYDQAMAHARRRDYPEAYASLAQLPEDSPFLANDEARNVFDQYAIAQIRQADRMTGRDPDRAREIAQQVLALGDHLSAERQGDAREIIRAANRAGASRPAAAVNPAASRQRQARSTRVQPAAEEPQQQRATPQPPSSSGGNPMRTCVSASNYSRCIIDAYDHGRTARSCDEIKAVTEAYRTLGNEAAALRLMRTFVDRCGGAREAHQYRQILQRHGQ